MRLAKESPPFITAAEKGEGVHVENGSHPHLQRACPCCEAAALSTVCQKTLVLTALWAQWARWAQDSQRQLRAVKRHQTENRRSKQQLGNSRTTHSPAWLLRHEKISPWANWPAQGKRPKILTFGWREEERGKEIARSRIVSRQQSPS